MFAQQNHAAQLHNEANAIINQATERNDLLLNKALSGYKTALEYRNHPDTRYNAELLQQTLKNIATENIQQPTTGN
jgi:deoxycytidylate deaminase